MHADKIITFECYSFGGAFGGGGWCTEHWSFKHGPPFHWYFMQVMFLNCYGIDGGVCPIFGGWAHMHVMYIEG